MNYIEEYKNILKEKDKEFEFQKQTKDKIHELTNQYILPLEDEISRLKEIHGINKLRDDFYKSENAVKIYLLELNQCTLKFIAEKILNSIKPLSNFKNILRSDDGVLYEIIGPSNKKELQEFLKLILEISELKIWRSGGETDLCGHMIYNDILVCGEDYSDEYKKYKFIFRGIECNDKLANLSTIEKINKLL